MPKAPFVDSLGQKGKEVDLPPEIFDVQINMPILHEVINAQLAAARSGTHSTKTRAEVRGGGAKPWRQKGTGRARHGSIREPQWVGGGIAHGPKPRDYSTRINKKEKQLALKSALTDRAREGKLLVIEFPDFEEPETKKAVDLLKEWDATGRTLIVVSQKDEEAQKQAWLSFRNLPHVLTVTYPTAYTVLAADTVIFTKSALDELTSTREPSSGTVAGSKRKASARPPRAPRTAVSPTPTASESPRLDESPSADTADASKVSSPSTAPSGGLDSPTSKTEASGGLADEGSPQAATATEEQSGAAKEASEGPPAVSEGDPASGLPGAEAGGPTQATETEQSGGTAESAARTSGATNTGPEPAVEPTADVEGEPK